MHNPGEFDSYFKLFEWELDQDGNNYAPDWVLYKSEDAVLKLRTKAASYGGPISISHFIRAFNELRASGEIRQIRQPRPAEPETAELTAEAYRSLPSAVVQRRFRSDPEFRSQVESLIAQGKI
jgi:hypothetical protein